MLNHFHDLVAIKTGCVALFSGAVSLGFEALLGNAATFQTILTVVGSVAVTLGALSLKEYFDRRRQNNTTVLQLRLQDGMTAIEREKILDGKVDTLFEELKAFYTLRDKEKDSSINLLRALAEQQTLLLGQQRELITQQAATIQRMQPQPGA